MYPCAHAHTRPGAHPWTLICTRARRSNYLVIIGKMVTKRLQNGLVPCKRSSPVVEYRHGNGLDRKGSPNPNNARSDGAGKFPDKSPKGKRSFPERKEVQKQIVRNGAQA
nr:MAG TPA: hypothetical protein [Caudoviricetes sp.]